MPLSTLRLDEERELLVVSILEDSSKLLPCDVERLGEYASVGGHSHEVRIPAPSRQCVKVHMVGDAGTCGFPQVEAHVDPAWKIDLPKSQL